MSSDLWFDQLCLWWTKLYTSHSICNKLWSYPVKQIGLFNVKILNLLKRIKWSTTDSDRLLIAENKEHSVWFDRLITFVTTFSSEMLNLSISYLLFCWSFNVLWRIVHLRARCCHFTSHTVTNKLYLLQYWFLPSHLVWLFLLSYIR